MVQNDIARGLNLILQEIGILQQTFANRRFTIDGRLVGDIGEIIAAAEYDVTLDETSQSRHDGQTSDEPSYAAWKSTNSVMWRIPVLTFCSHGGD